MEQDAHQSGITGKTIADWSYRKILLMSFLSGLMMAFLMILFGCLRLTGPFISCTVPWPIVLIAGSVLYLRLESRIKVFTAGVLFIVWPALGYWALCYPVPRLHDLWPSSRQFSWSMIADIELGSLIPVLIKHMFEWILGWLVLCSTLGLALRTAVPNRQRRRLGLCNHCGYDLTGLSEQRCPECGTEFGKH